MKRWIIRCIEQCNPDAFWVDYSGIIHTDPEAARAEVRKAAVEHRKTHLFMIAEVVEDDSSAGDI